MPEKEYNPIDVEDKIFKECQQQQFELQIIQQNYEVIGSLNKLLWLTPLALVLYLLVGNYDPFKLEAPGLVFCVIFGAFWICILMLRTMTKRDHDLYVKEFNKRWGN